MKDFEIPIMPSCTKKTIRFPNHIVQSVEHQIKWRKCSFSSFVVAAVKYALDTLEEKEKEAK